MHISRALLSSKLENERAKRREIMFVSKMNTVGKAYDRAFELISVPEDGNCMYHAILSTMNSLRPVSADHHTLRALVAEELLHNREKYLELFDVAYHTAFSDNTTYVDKYNRCTYDEYVDDMSKDGTYGDELALQAFANLSSLSVRIISSSDGDDTATTVFMPTEPMNARGRVAIVNRNSEHFYGCKWVSPEPSQPPNLQTSPALRRQNDASSDNGGAPANAVGGEVHRDTPGGGRVEGKFVVVSWNVTTLSARNNKSADYYMGKLGFFTSLFLDYGFDIVAMQETRTA
jgi:hypothetical protein